MSLDIQFFVPQVNLEKGGKTKHPIDYMNISVQVLLLDK